MLVGIDVKAPRERKWEPNREAAHCRKCVKSFGLTRLRHHCRSCGRNFCNDCASFYVRLPSSEMCPGRPSYVTQDKPLRCCFECSQRAKVEVFIENRRVLQQCRAIRDDMGLRTTDTLELLRQYPTKLYLVQLPRNLWVRHNHIMSMVLDNKVHHAFVPGGLGPGDMFYVRANDGFVGALHTAAQHPYTNLVISQSMMMDLGRVMEIMHEHALAPPAPPPKAVPEKHLYTASAPPGEPVPCPRCTFRNDPRLEFCTMCCARVPV
jgi:hypothetical protein